MKNFEQLGLSEPIVRAVTEQGYTTPTPIQLQSVPAVLTGRDLMAAAQTGTGKTAGFTLPILEQLAKGKKAKPNCTRALILTPTRELAAQIQDNVELYSQYLPIKSAVVFGGVKINPQMQKLRSGTDILVATPGRLLDLHQQNAIRFEDLEVLVLDEADRMLDMGFIHDIKRIIKILPKKRQNLLFSATFSEDIRALAKGLITDPVEISVTPKNSTAKTVDQLIYPVDKKRKPELLKHLIKTNSWHQVLVFTRTKHGANKLVKQLIADDIPAAAIHGNKSQGARTRALAEFKDNQIQVLVATDIAARGIDIDLLPHVVNFDLPNVSEDYVHRIGRTGRAGSSGKAVSLVSADELDDLKGIERLIQKVLPREIVDDFYPDHMLPTTTLDTRPIRKRPKKKPQQSRNSQNREAPKQGQNRNSQNKSGQSRSTNSRGTGEGRQRKSVNQSSRNNNK
ncbi:MAG: DEAD/DEAH box helicase [Gammaproteobacteria bacterium]|nr:DEAD/DEAH box helicase [Gammaproteobacteria bacterium]